MGIDKIVLYLAVVVLSIGFKQKTKLKDVYRQCYISMPYNETAQNYSMQNEKLLEIMKNCVEQKTIIMDNEKQKTPKEKRLDQLCRYLFTISMIYVVLFITKK